MIGSNRAQRRAMQAALVAANRAFGPVLAEIPREAWPEWRQGDHPPQRVLRSREFLVQVFCHERAVRLSVSRTALRTDGRWEDGITWDELQRLKAEAGYGAYWAVEVYPPDDEVVNVGNLRHLWLTDAPPFAWRRR